MKTKRKWIKTTGALALCAALVASVFFGFSGSRALAVTSLPHIVDILSSMTGGNSFDVLEVVPDGGTGTIGYYIGGQEPRADAALSGLSGAEARAAAASALLSDLKARRILSAGTDTPLTVSGAEYAEKKPWEMADADYASMMELTLAASETAEVTGVFTPGAGGYDKVMQYTAADPSARNDHVQVIDRFVFTAAQEEGFYYYAPAFAQFTADSAQPAGGTAIYANTANDCLLNGYTDGTADNAEKGLEPAPDGYYYYGSWGDASLSLDMDASYYTVSATGAPGSYESGCRYKAISSDFVLVGSGETGYFSLVSYRYVGSGQGHYSFTPAAGGETVNVDFSKVWYSLGYENNQWFKKYVFDMSENLSSVNMTVRTVSAGSVTVSDVSTAELIVLSDGSYSLGGEVSAAIVSAVNDSDIPLIISSALSGSSVGALISGMAANSVRANVLCLTLPFSFGGGSIGELATEHFNAPFSSEVVSSGFSAVLSEIQNENFLRVNEDASTTDLLPEQVTLANSIRYIINFAEQRAVGSKEHITVLELQPGSAHTLTEAAVRSWLGDPAELKTVTIVPMSTSEFIGRIDDLAETYDLIYIGRSGVSTTYTDSSMNGLYYTNIGDYAYTNYKLSGMLDRDYASTFSNGYRRIQADRESYTMRYSGNDLTQAKAGELLDFAQAGYPVVIDKELTLSTQPVTVETRFSAEIGYSANSSNRVTLDVSVRADSGALPDYDPSYSWYKDGVLINGEDDDDYSFTPAVGSSGVYCCKVTYTVGGVGYTAVSNSLTITATQGAGLQVQNVGGGSTNQEYSGSVSYDLSIRGVRDSNGKCTYTVSSSPALPSTGVTYAWYRGLNNNWNTWSSSKDSNTLTTSKNDNQSYDYYCEVTVSSGNSNSTGQTQKIGYYTNGFKTYGTETNPTFTSSTPFTVVVTPTVSGNTVTLAGSTSPAVPAQGYWYEDGDYMSGSSSITASAGHTYVFYVYYQDGYNRWGNPTYDWARSDGYRVTNSSMKLDVSSSAGTPGVIPKQLARYAVNTLKVDYASNLYSTLNAAVGLTNVMSASELESADAYYKDNRSTLLKYLNLSKPQIDWFGGEAGYPTEYSMSSTGVITSLAADSAGKHVLSYRFRIVNETDATPKTTTYDCRLYIDLNSNGLYADAEQITDTVVRYMNADGSAGALITPVRDSSGTFRYQLSANVYYIVTREMPADYSGILPWKLEVSKNNADNIHASVHKYTHIATEAKTINVLQIMAQSGSGMNLRTNGTYRTELAKVADFDVSISTINANSIAVSADGTINNISYRDGSGNQKYTGRVKLADFFKNFDMLILGFDDAYREISDLAAKAILDYSASNAVLFTHDTTSIVNLPANNYPTTANGTVNQGAYYWGYSFNTILRDRVGLDRYGVTSPKYGITKYATSALLALRDSSSRAPGLVAAGYADMSSYNTEDYNVETAILGDGYSIAYKPKAVAVSSISADYSPGTVGEVQGYTKYALKRFSTSGDLFDGDNGLYSTTTVSQVNEGQITTYPFNLNNSKFGGKLTGDLSIASTHEQYYQLNLNSADVVVWYCLSGSSFNSPSNDVLNSYYIYSVGNITYSGAGHSGGSVTSQEAQLFINTMIAAFRTATDEPTVDFKSDASGRADVGYSFVTSDYSSADGSSVNSEFLASDDNRIYFKISDPALLKNRVIQLYLYYDCRDSRGGLIAGMSTTPSIPTVIYSADSDAKVTSLSGGLVYYIKLSDIDGLLSDLQTANSATIHLAVTTGSAVPAAEDYKALEVRKIGLFPLA